MKKLLSYTILSFFFLLASIIFLLSTKGYETDRFNDIISKELKKNQENLEIKFKKIKVQLDFKKRNIFFNTKNPKISFRNIDLPILDIKIYVGFFSLLKSNLEISRSTVSYKDIDIEKIQKLAVFIKPSNIKSFLLNNINNGQINGSFDLNYLKDLKIKNYKINGSVKNLEIYNKKKLKFVNTNFNFVADKELILVNSFNSNFHEISLKNGSLDINIKDNYIINGSVKTKAKYNETEVRKINSFFLDSKFINNNKINLNANLLHEFSANLSKEFELLDYKYSLTGPIKNLNIDLKHNIKTPFIKDEISKIILSDNQIELSINNENKNFLKLEGKHKINNSNFEKYVIKDNFGLSKHNININLNISNEINIKLINYYKKAQDVGSINCNLIFNKGKLDLKKLEFKENQSTISLQGLKFDEKNIFNSLKSIKIKTFKVNKLQNNFDILYGKKIKILGSSYDSSNIIEILNEKNKVNPFNNINKEISIDLKNIIVKRSTNLSNFNLIGTIKKGKFIKLSSKSEFSNNKYLDISLKEDPISKKKTLEIFSDLPKPILADYSFFNGLEDGKLLYISTFDRNQTQSKLTIENFKVKNAPGFAKLLALADFGGMVDLMSGDGLSFEKLEINLINDPNTLNIEEIFAVGPSISILMDGYIENKTDGITSLRGTMVPAKNLNKLISKIPIIGDILIPKEIGEGLFGVSFKMKGKKGEIKTSVNPIKTLTPRFITKALEKRKKTK